MKRNDLSLRMGNWFTFFLQALFSLKDPFFHEEITMIHPHHSLVESSAVCYNISISGSVSKPPVFGASRSWKLMCVEGSRLHQIFRCVWSIFFFLSNSYLMSSSASSFWKGWVPEKNQKMFKFAQVKFPCDMQTWLNPAAELQLENVAANHRFIHSVLSPFQHL